MEKSYEARKEAEIRKSGTILVKEKQPKREKQKRKTVNAIVYNLPSTLQVLHKRTELSKTCLLRYLKKLISVRVVRRELDMYFLDEDYILNVTPHPNFSSVWDRWLDLPEYQTPKVLEPNKKGSAIKLVVKGKKPIVY